MTEAEVNKICTMFNKMPRYSEVSCSNLNIFAYESESIYEYSKLDIEIKDFTILANMVSGLVIVESFTGTSLDNSHITKMLVEIFISLRNNISLEDGIYNNDDLYEMFTNDLYKSMSQYGLKYRICKDVHIEDICNIMESIYKILAVDDYIMFIGWQVGYRAYVLNGY